MKNIEKHGIKGNSKTFFILAIMAGFGIGLLEVLIVVVEHIIWGVTILDNVSFFLVMRHWGITILLWGIFAVVLYRAAKANGFKFFSVIDKPTIQNLIIVAVLLGILIIVSYVDWDYQFKPYAEYLGKLNACFLQVLFGQKCKTFLDIIACPFWTMLQRHFLDVSLSKYTADIM